MSKMYTLYVTQDIDRLLLCHLTANTIKDMVDYKVIDSNNYYWVIDYQLDGDIRLSNTEYDIIVQSDTDTSILFTTLEEIETSRFYE